LEGACITSGCGFCYFKDMEYSEIEYEMANISRMVAGTGFIDTLDPMQKWEVYEMFKKLNQSLSPDEYTEAIQHATDILEL
jgi:hypothetical protein